MKELRRISVPWNPYTVLFDGRGLLLVAGGGSSYGQGGLVVCRLADGVSWSTSLSDSSGGTRRAPTVSGLCMDANDEYLVASTWARGHQHAPCQLFRLEAGRSVHVETLPQRWRDPMDGPVATGVLFFANHVVARCDTNTRADTFAVLPMPADVEVETRGIAQHLASRRLAIVNDTLITGAGGSTAIVGWRRDIGRFEQGKAGTGLLTLPWGSDPRDTGAIPVASCARVTAIGACPAGDGFITGGLDGEVDRWIWNGRWSQRRLQSAHETQPPEHPDLAWATYRPSSIVGICHMADARHWLTVNAGGEVRLWLDERCLGVWRLAHPGSPRSLACHPREPWFVVACKAGHDSALILATVDGAGRG